MTGFIFLSSLCLFFHWKVSIEHPFHTRYHARHWWDEVSKSKYSLCPRGDNSLVGEGDIHGAIAGYELSQENTRYKGEMPATSLPVACGGQVTLGDCEQQYFTSCLHWSSISPNGSMSMSGLKRGSNIKYPSFLAQTQKNIEAEGDLIYLCCFIYTSFIAFPVWGCIFT